MRNIPYLLLFLFPIVGLCQPQEQLRIYLGDPEKEFQENIKNEKLVPYATGSLMYGYRFPGISATDLDKYFPSWKDSFVNRFPDDPAPFFIEDYSFTIEEYWEGVEWFLTRYNTLLLDQMNRKA